MDAIVTPNNDQNKLNCDDIVDILIERSMKINELKLQLSLAQKKIAMLELVWKKGRPEKDGWYLVCESGFEHNKNCFSIVKIKNNDDSFWWKMRLERSAWDNFLFAGPIEMPKVLNKSEEIQ